MQRILISPSVFLFTYISKVFLGTLLMMGFLRLDISKVFFGISKGFFGKRVFSPRSGDFLVIFAKNNRRPKDTQKTLLMSKSKKQHCFQVNDLL